MVAAEPKTKKKGSGARLWMRMDKLGQSEVIECDKSTIIKRVGVPTRDLRVLLGPVFSHSSNILEFSESLREMGDCLLEKTALNDDDEESGKVLLMLGKVQFVIQNLVDRYVGDPISSRQSPSRQSPFLMNCVLLRMIYEEMIPKSRGKGRSKSSKGDSFSVREVQAAQDEYDEDASLFVFRMKSLKGGQSRSLLTQASRHYAGQMSFFRKASKSLEAIDPQVESVTARHHIAYHFDGLEDEDDASGGDDIHENYTDDTDDDSESLDDNELSFDHGHANHGQEDSITKDSMDLDEVDIKFPKPPTVEVKENINRKPGDNSLLRRNLDLSSKSAPLLIGKDSDPAERYVPSRKSSTRKFSTYVLPTPDETKSRSDAQTPQGRVSVSGGTISSWHSSPLEHKRSDKVLGNENSSPVLSKMQSVLKDSNSNIRPSRSPPQLAEGLSSHIDRHGDTKKVRRQALFGLLMGKSWSSRANTSASGPIASTRNALFSGSLMRTPLPKSTSSPVLSSAREKGGGLSSLRRMIIRRKTKKPSAGIAESSGVVHSPPNVSNSLSAMVAAGPKTKKKGCGARLCMRMDELGQSEVIECNKSTIIKRFGVPTRDLRVLLSPVFSHSSNILARKKAIIVNLEFIKAIIAAEEIMLLYLLRKEVVPFVDHLRLQFSQRSPRRTDGAGQLAIHDTEHLTLPGQWLPVSEAVEGFQAELPFEFQILETALELICTSLESSVADLERVAYPVLDELARNVSTKNLEHVRSLKSNLTRLLARVQKVGDEIEHLLDDNEDMAQLYLTRKLVQLQQSEALIGSMASNIITATAFDLRRLSPVRSGSIVTSNYSNDNDVEDLEMLLEAYFMQLDGTRNKILSVREYIDDTEDYVNIQLDNQRNELIQLQLTLTIASFAIVVETLVAGMFGMNIDCSFHMNGIFEIFVAVLTAVCVLIFFLVLGYARWKKILGS